MRPSRAMALRCFLSLVFCLLISRLVFAQAPAPLSRITQAVDETRLTLLKGNTYPLARPEFDQGAAPPDLAMLRMLLVLTRGPEQEAALDAFMNEQQDKASPNYHKWLTPEQFGQLFGPSDGDIQTVTSWLQSHGFQIGRIAKGRTVIEFSGRAAQVQEAFHTAIHKYSVKGEEHWANASDPQVPTAITPVVAGVVTLHNFPRKQMHQIAGVFSRSKASGKVEAVKPENSFFTFPGGCGLNGICYALGPFDFATIYNVLPLWNGAPAIDGTGETIAIVAETEINLQDVKDFRNAFGMPPPNVHVMLDGPDPGIQLSTGDETESDLDVEWSGAVAKNATIDFVVSASTNTTLGVDLSAEYIVDNNVAPVMSESYGECELAVGTAGNQFYNQLWQQAAAEGITAFLSSGDSGAAVCDRGNLVAVNGLSVSGFSSTPYNVSVGGTDFIDLQNPTKYWNANNNPTTQESAKGYIPETTWNDSCTNSEVSILTGSMDAEANCNNPSVPQFLNVTGGSGGKSNCTTSDGQNVGTCTGGYSKPPWQTGPGVPNDMKRDVPDVSLFASDGLNGNFYIICERDFNGSGLPCDLNSGLFLGIGGTSASSPAFAGILAMVNQKTQSRQGNANFVFYPLAAKTGNSCNSSGTLNNSCVFYDVTSGTIAMPCSKGSVDCNTKHPADTVGILTGYTTTAGYDLATGLGSVNVTNLVNNWSSVAFRPSATTLALNPTMNIPHGTAVNATIAVSPTSGGGTPTGQVSLLTSANQGVTNFTLSNGTVSSPTSVLPGGSYTVTAHYAGDGTFGASDSTPPVAVTVLPEPSVTTDAAFTFNGLGQLVPFSGGPYGGFVYLRADVKGQSGNGVATGSVNFTDNNTNITGGPYPLNSEGNTNTPNGLVTFSTGPHSIGANYLGDASFNASSATSPATFTITPATTAAVLTVSPIRVTVGGNVSLNVVINTNAGFNPITGTYGGGSLPTGTVTFYLGFFSQGTQIGSPVVVTGRVNPGTQTAQATASLMTSQLPVGQDIITATYSGDTNYMTSAGGPSGVSVMIPTTTTAGSSSQTIVEGTNVTLTAQVMPTLNNGPAITGTVLFEENGNFLGQPISISNNQAQLTTNSLPAGNLTISAIYSGDINYVFSSGTTPLTVNPAYILSAGPTTVNISSPGGMGSTTITVMDQNGFNGTVSFTSASCMGLPREASCSFNPASVTGSGTTTLTIMTKAPSMLVPVNQPGDFGGWAARRLVSLLCIFCMVIVLLAWRRNRARWQTVFAVFIFGLLMACAACGGGSGGGGGSHDPGTPVGSFPITVMGTSGNLQHSVPITLTVQ